MISVLKNEVLDPEKCILDPKNEGLGAKKGVWTKNCAFGPQNDPKNEGFDPKMRVWA